MLHFGTVGVGYGCVRQKYFKVCSKSFCKFRQTADHLSQLTCSARFSDAQNKNSIPTVDISASQKRAKIDFDCKIFWRRLCYGHVSTPSFSKYLKVQPRSEKTASASVYRLDYERYSISELHVEIVA